MIKPLTIENDKMEMIKIIKLINPRIDLFFQNKYKENTININGSWGSGKSTIVNNLEEYYTNKNDNIQWILINLWEYETSSDPYFDLINDIADKIIYFSKINDQDKEKEIIKIRKLSFSLRIKYQDWELTPAIGYESNKKTVKQKQLKDIIKDLIDNLNHIVENNKIVIIFDELDRCTPNNQIYFLSYIKNMFFKIAKIFYIVSSNNRAINSNINTKIDKNNLEIEKYTDKLFNITINLRDVFSSKRMKFTNNKHINEFVKKINIVNPRNINKILIQVCSTIQFLKNDTTFSFLNFSTNNEKDLDIISRFEFISFYIYYLKYNHHDDYINILDFMNIDLLKSHFVNNLESYLITKNNKFKNKGKQWLINKIINNTYSNHFEQENIYFLIKDIENNIEFSNTSYFQFLLPFFATYLENNNLDLCFKVTKRETSTITVDNNQCYISEYTLILEKINCPNHFKYFFETWFEISELMFLANDDFRYQFWHVNKIIENSILDY